MTSDVREKLLELYVYYGVDPSQVDPARTALLAAQAALCRDWPGLQARLLQRADAARPGQPLTWMEIYRHPDGLSHDRLAALREGLAALPPGRLSDRHEERFMPFPNPATGA
ncbi:DUF4936 family protein [Sphaerotilus mobilis]|uniref:Uncharacterized protein DUF4936 n=1 Tax=Sphaerotilus mobilis TaxID=47994 RepID=A0A4Q7LRD4_9BURK|nr:DUF4936 family protein [Sphaerotilus mobilis]RZS56762.1 uncharacterized protein DUF4936 [Sphaerotilus mobilis]